LIVSLVERITHLAYGDSTFLYIEKYFLYSYDLKFQIFMSNTC